MLPVVRYSCLHLNLIAIESASRTRTDTARSGLDWLREASRGYPNFRRNWRSFSFMTINCRRADTGTRISPRRQLKCIQITYCHAIAGTSGTSNTNIRTYVPSTVTRIGFGSVFALSCRCAHTCQLPRQRPHQIAKHKMDSTLALDCIHVYVSDRRS